jgi:hypothetical protein
MSPDSNNRSTLFEEEEEEEEEEEWQIIHCFRRDNIFLYRQVSRETVGQRESSCGAQGRYVEIMIVGGGALK